jgi:hypothetical protein
VVVAADAIAETAVATAATGNRSFELASPNMVS